MRTPFLFTLKIKQATVYTDKRFRKSERLNLRNDIDAIFNLGKMARSYPILSKYRLVEDEENLVRILVSVPKRKVKKASERNRIKRLIRETYRLLKTSFTGQELPDNKGLHVALILTGNSDTQATEIRTSMEKVFRNIFIELKTAS